MNILITGVAGYIGSVVCELLLEQGHQVTGIDNFQEGKQSSVNKNIKFYEGDIGNQDILNKIFSENRVDLVFHFSAETTIEYSMTDPYKYFQNNVINGIVLLEAMKKHNCRDIIFSSTAAIYGEPKYTPIDENHEHNPINAYGESKLMFEKIIDWYHSAYGFRYNLFRYFNAAGATKLNGENRRHESHILPLIFKSLHSNSDVLKIYGNDYPTIDGTCIRDYIHVIDIANAHILSMNNLDKISNGKYNIGSGKGFSLLDILNIIKKVTNKNINWEFANRRSGDPAILVASNKLASLELGWKPLNSSIENIISTAYEWSLNHNLN